MDSQKDFDVIIVGAGITGSIIAKELSSKCPGLEILILEAGPGSSSDFNTYKKYNDTFFKSLTKLPNSPYVNSPFAPSPSESDLDQFKNNQPDTNGYFIQKGPFPFLSNYNRNVGGTTLHWLGTTLRMCPTDFKMKTLYGRGVDWPIGYKELKRFYRKAEYEIGVAGEAKEQNYLGITFKDGYCYPMHKIPQSYMDKYMAGGLEGLTFEDEGESYFINVVSTPQARNGMPNHDYFNEETKQRGFVPVGAVGAPELGQRCEGNSNCEAICPVQAKYNALKTLNAAINSKNSKIDLYKQSPVSRIETDSGSGYVKRVHYKTYEIDHKGLRTNIQSHSVSGKIVVLAANAIENAKILLSSNACRESGQVGKNLMDHLVIITWGLFPQAIGAYRGPASTSGMPTMRDGPFRKNRSAFRVEIGNWGWAWPENTPESTLIDAVDDKKLFGSELIDHIRDHSGKEIRIGWEMEQLPSDRNFISIDKNYKDGLGNYRPVIHYELNDYEKKGALVASKLSSSLFKRLNIESKSVYRETDPGYFNYSYVEDGKRQVFEGSFNGAGHVIGCHRMGTDRNTSVVDSFQRAHEHPNLFVAGAGSFPTIGTSNPTLTMAALAFRTAEEISKEFN